MRDPISCMHMGMHKVNNDTQPEGNTRYRPEQLLLRADWRINSEKRRCFPPPKKEEKNQH